jgi:RNA methyltransferase, TrmH family
MPTAITSRQNPWFKRVREAMREHRDEIVIEGPKAVADAIAGGWKPVAVFHRSQVAGRGSQGDFAFSSALFDALAETKSPQNVMGLFERPRVSLSSVLGSRSSVVVALDGVQDPGNVGTIVRLAAAFDCAGVVLLPGCADAYSPKAIRASVGAALSVHIVDATAKELIASGVPIYAADARGDASPPPAGGAIIVFGNEGAGVSDAIRRVATPIAVAMSPRIESLNVAASAAILLSKSYEARRGR